MPDATSSTSVSSIPGIDVSRYQGPIDWSAAAAAGIQFVFVRATRGQTLVDPLFTAHWAGTQSAGIPRGAYHFFHPDISPQAQADNFLAAIKNVDPAELAPALDLELRKSDGTDAWDAIPLAQRAALAVQWLTAVEQSLGRRPIVYLSPSFAHDKLGGAAALGAYPLWIAHYTTNPQPRVPPAWQHWTFWQYTQQGSVNGIMGAVDLDRFNGSPGDLLGAPATTPQPGS